MLGATQRKKKKRAKTEAKKDDKARSRALLRRPTTWKKPLSEVVSSQPAYRVASLPCYHRQRLQAMLQERGYAGQPEQLAVEDDRCQADPIYRLHWRPYDQLDQIDFDDPTEPVVGHVAVIDKILGGMIEILEHKYGSGLKKARIVRDAHEYLLSPRASHRVKLFYIYFVMHKEPEACEMIRTLFDPQHAGNLWGEGIYDHFDAFMLFVDDCVKKTLVFPASESNINPIVNDMVLATKTEWLLH